MQLEPNLARQVTSSLLRIFAKNAYFATLAMFARFEQSTEIPTAATDGRTVYVNKTFWDGLTPPAQDGLLLHEVLHAALLHVPRRTGRDPKLWNIAADVVINGMVLREGYTLPEGGVVRPELEHLSTEEIYEQLIKERTEDKDKDKGQDGAGQPGTGEAGESGAPSMRRDLLDQAPKDAQARLAEAGSGDSAEDHWKKAQQQAQLAMKSTVAGTAPGNLSRELGSVHEATLDWRSYLWRYLTQTPTDFNDFDRRFVGRGTYLETLSGESAQVLVAIDTSGSIDLQMVEAFVSELLGILHSYPHLQLDLYYADTQVYGPHRLKAGVPVPTPQGGGGTDFRPFFEAIESHAFRRGSTVAIYLTDGFGEFPEPPPRVPTLWVVTPGGLDVSKFPFGETIRLLPSQQTPFVVAIPPRVTWVG